MRGLLLAGLFLLALGAAAPGARAADWSYTTLDPTRNSGNYLAMRLNAEGLRRFAWWTPSEGIIVAGDGWVREVLPGPYEPQDAGEPRAPGPASTQLLITNSVDLALGPDDTPWVAHVRHDCFGNCTGTARVSHRGGSGWSTEDLGVAYSMPAIEAGADGRVHVCYAGYASGTYELRYWVRGAEGGWTEEPVAPSSEPPSLRLDATGTPHLAWAEGGRAWYAARTNGAWQAQVADSGGVTGTKLVLSAEGGPRLAYITNGTGLPKGLWFAEPGPGGWTRTRVVPNLDSAWPAGLALDPAGDPFIAFNDQDGLDLRCASRKQGVWAVSDVDTEGNTGYTPCVAFDPAGHTLVAYQADGGIGTRLATGQVIVGVEGPRPPAAFAIRALGGIVRAGQALALEVTSPEATTVSLMLVDVAGRALATLPARAIPAGVSRIAWEAGSLPPGVCFVLARTTDGAVAASRFDVLR